MRIIATACLLFILSSSAVSVLAAPRFDAKARGEFLLKAYRSNPKGWQVLCNSSDLHVAVRNDATYLYVLAVAWSDNDAGLGLSPGRGKPIGDYSTLMIHFGSGKRMREGGEDVDVYLNPWPETPGIQLARYIVEDLRAPMEKSAAGAGSIEYEALDTTRVRVDRYKVPLSEIGLRPGAKFRTAYFLSSPTPQLTLNSVGLTQEEDYLPANVPLSMFKVVSLQRPK